MNIYDFSFYYISIMFIIYWIRIKKIYSIYDFEYSFNYLLSTYNL